VGSQPLFDVVLHVNRTAVGRVRLDQYLAPGGLVINLMRSRSLRIDSRHVLQGNDAAVGQADRQLLQRHKVLAMHRVETQQNLEKSSAVHDFRNDAAVHRGLNHLVDLLRGQTISLQPGSIKRDADLFHIDLDRIDADGADAGNVVDQVLDAFRAFPELAEVIAAEFHGNLRPRAGAEMVDQMLQRLVGKRDRSGDVLQADQLL